MRNRASHILSLLILFTGVSLSSWSQINDVTVSPIWSLNTEADEIFCSFILDDIVITSNQSDIIIDDYHRVKNNFTLYQGTELAQAYQYKIEKEFLSKRVFEDVGTACYSELDDVLWFSSAYNFNKSKGKTLKIFSIKKTKRGWRKTKSFKYNSETYSIAHPWINEDGTQLFFSSDMEGGAGGMDIWFCNRIDSKRWSDPIWAGDAINSPANELFPTLHNGDIYFSSNVNPSNGYDIYRAFRSDQWESTERVKSPINSSGDDFQFVYRDDNSGFFTSNRAKGKGGDDIYFFRIRNQIESTDSLKFLLQFKDTPLQSAQILFTDIEDVILKDESTDKNGVIPVEGMNLQALKKIYVLDVEDQLLRDCILYLIDSKGEKIRSFRFGKNGFFEFEYLPLDLLGDLPKMDETDESLLTVMLQGQVYEQEPGDIGSGEPVYITNEEGEVLALSYTSEQGKFTIDELEPLKNYTFVFDEETRASFVQIDQVDKDKTFLTIKNGKAFYQRLSDKNSLRIIDENKRPIYIDENEVFIIKNIYYSFESHELNEVAKEQLDDLAVILRNNPRIKIELSSHTDSRGTHSFNLNLSNLRAKEAVDYLISKGVPESRMTGIGHGEYRLMNECDDETDCEEEKHALNRRTEIQIYAK